MIKLGGDTNYKRPSSPTLRSAAGNGCALRCKFVVISVYCLLCRSGDDQDSKLGQDLALLGLANFPKHQ